jgi:hypothetical protein
LENREFMLHKVHHRGGGCGIIGPAQVLKGLAPGLWGYFFCGECPPSRKGRRVLGIGFFIGDCFFFIAVNAAVWGSSLSFTGEAAACP